MGCPVEQSTKSQLKVFIKNKRRNPPGDLRRWPHLISRDKLHLFQCYPHLWTCFYLRRRGGQWLPRVGVGVRNGVEEKWHYWITREHFYRSTLKNEKRCIQWLHRRSAPFQKHLLSVSVCEIHGQNPRTVPKTLSVRLTDNVIKT